MPNKKRGAESDAAGEGSAKATKAARTEKNGDGSKRGAKKAAATGATTLSNTEFKAKALPLHLNLTHTPPGISKEQGSNDGDGANLANATVTGITSGVDAGFIGNLTLVPAVFSTGSYGWKGNKRMTVELQDGDTDAEGGKEKVQIMLTVNATVVGSKAASKSSKGKEQEQEEVVEEAEHIDEDDANGE